MNIKFMTSNTSFDDLPVMKEWCIFILEYMASEYSGGATFQPGRTYHDYFRHKIGVIESCNSARSMRLARKDVNELARLEVKNIARLNELLQQEFGKVL